LLILSAVAKIVRNVIIGMNEQPVSKARTKYFSSNFSIDSIATEQQAI